jgi:hypothetical protein
MGLGLLGQGQQGGIGDLGAFLSAQQQMGGSLLTDDMLRLLTAQASAAQ